MSFLVFTCPATKQHVQHWLDDAERRDGDDAYVTVPCQACARLHFLNPKTGNLLGQRGNSEGG